MSYQVFISYSHIDSQIAHGLCYKLEDEGISCWIAPRDIKAGDVWAKAISKAIPQCKIMLLVLSGNSNSSDQVLREVELAVQKKLVIVPVRIDDIVPTDGMSYYLATTHWINIKGKHINSKFSIISKQIKDILGIVDKNPVMEKPTEKQTAGKPKIPKTQNITSNRKRMLFIGLPILLAAAACILLIINWNNLFYKTSDSQNALNAADTPTEESTPVPEETTDDAEIADTPTAEETPRATPQPEETVYTPQDLNMTPDAKIEFTDSVLDSCISQTLAHMGYDADDRTIESILKIETLLISTPQAEESFLLAGIEREVMLRGYNDYFKCIVDKNIFSLEGMQYIKNLKHFIITGQSLDDISMLENLDKLEIIYLPGNHIESIESLANKPNLKIIGLDNNNLADISVLESSAANVTHLYMYGCSYIEDFSVIADFNQLIDLGLSSTSVSNVDAFKDLENLVALRLRFTNISNWQDLGIIASAENMESLFLNNTEIDDISFLANYINLQDLYLDNTNISDIQALKNLTNLKNLNIMNTNVTDFSVLDVMYVEEIYMDQKLYDSNLTLGQKLIVNGSRIYTENGYMGD